jgi:hypothetical protein
VLYSEAKKEDDIVVKAGEGGVFKLTLEAAVGVTPVFVVVLAKVLHGATVGRTHDEGRERVRRRRGVQGDARVARGRPALYVSPLVTVERWLDLHRERIEATG